MGQLLEYFKMALDNIQANKGRSILTMLGIIIGISSVIMIMSIGQGAKGEIGDQLSAMAGGQIFISGAYSDSNQIYLTPEDMEAIKEVEGVKGVTPSDSMSGKLLSPRNVEFALSVTTGTADLKYTHNPEMKYGRYFSDSDVDSMNLVAVIGEGDARKLFGTDDVVGMSVEATIYDTTQEIIDYLQGYYNMGPEDILPLSGEPGPDTEGYFTFDEPLDLSQVDYVVFGDVKIPVSGE